MKLPRDLTGQRIVRLLVLHQVEDSVDGMARWLCRCDCGELVAVKEQYLREAGPRRGTKSCGCLRREIAAGLAEVRRAQRAA